jgi:protein required for attachment to host cells
MNTVWVLVCDAARGRLFEVGEGDGSVHHNALAPASSPKEVEQGHFSHTLANALDQAARAKRFRRWVLVAPPHFLGMLKKELTAEVSASLMTTVDKDLSRFELREIAEQLREAVRIPPDQRDVVREPRKHAH